MQNVNDNTFNVLAPYMKKKTKLCNPLKGEQAEMTPIIIN